MQNNFIFNLPTKIYFGKDSHLQIGQIIKEYGFKNVLVLYGMNHVKRSGLLDLVLGLLKKENINYVTFGNIRTNPTIENVNEGLKLAKENNIDFILPIGGGSVIDCGKLISTAYFYNGNPFDISLGKFKPIKRIPLGVILTVVGSGSEMSNSCVVQDDNLGIKSGYSSELNKPIFAICNPELTYTVSKKQTSIGIVDTLMHTLERYFSYSISDVEPSDYFAISLIKNVVDCSYKIFDCLDDYNLRSSLMIMSSFSHNGVTSIGKDYVMPVHKLEHVISALYPNVSHGEGLSILFLAWAKYYYIYDIEKFALLGEKIFHLAFKSKYENAKMCVIAFEQYFKWLGMPTTFTDLNLDIDIKLLLNKLRESGIRKIDHKNKYLDENVARIIYKMSI